MSGCQRQKSDDGVWIVEYAHDAMGKAGSLS